MHAEAIMLDKVSGRLPKDIWISRSPCEDCADKLSKAYKDEDKPTIHFVKFYIGSKYQRKKIKESPHIKRLMKLKNVNGFKLEVWDCIKDFKQHGDIDQALVEKINQDEGRSEGHFLTPHRRSLTHEGIIKDANARIKVDKKILEELLSSEEPLSSQQLSQDFAKLSMSGTS